jgi:uncharacterized repeat protein (TIGR04138 family)
MTTTDLMEAVRHTHYPLDAFVFVQRGLDYTVRRVHGEIDEEDAMRQELRQSRHVDGQTLCRGLRDYAIQQYGLMARTVLKRWNIHASEDFGRIVFAMVEAGLMQKTDEDTIEDFTDAFDFNEAFDQNLELSDKAMSL